MPCLERGHPLPAFSPPPCGLFASLGLCGLSEQNGDGPLATTRPQGNGLLEKPIAMSSLRRSKGKAKAKGFRTAAHWPSTEEIDGFTYELGPDPSEAQWASEALNQGDDGHTTDLPSDEYYDQLAAESEAMSRLERGLL